MKPLTIFVWIYLVFFSGHEAEAQQRQTDEKSYSYFLAISPIETREQVLALESLIRAKPTVTYFLAERFPVRNLELRTSKPIHASDVNRWLSGSSFQLIQFGADERSREAVVLFYKKRRSTH
ncbi:MAG: hypothetical protein ACKO5C_06715 [Ferruginibacter sp.]